MIWIACAIVVLAAIVDIRRREISNHFPIALIVCAVVGAALGAIGWQSLLLGSLFGISVGAVLFKLGAFGGGDAKLLAGIGACIGPIGLLWTMIYMGLAGGVLSVIAALRGAREIAYGPAIAAGLLVHIAVSTLGVPALRQ